jgi:hypothetical protein
MSGVFEKKSFAEQSFSNARRSSNKMKKCIANDGKEEEKQAHQNLIDFLFILETAFIFTVAQHGSRISLLHARSEERLYEGETFISNPKPVAKCTETQGARSLVGRTSPSHGKDAGGCGEDPRFESGRAHHQPNPTVELIKNSINREIVKVPIVHWGYVERRMVLGEGRQEEAAILLKACVHACV